MQQWDYSLLYESLEKSSVSGYFFSIFRKMHGVNARLQNLYAGRCRRKFLLQYGKISDGSKQLKDGNCGSHDGECAGKNFGTNGTLR